jgi:hypothetical protein
MIEIAQQESVVSSSPMWIDSVSVTEMSTTIIGFGLLLFLLLFSGVTGAGPISVQTVERAITNSSTKRFSFYLSPIVPFDRFLMVDLALVRAPDAGTSPDQSPISLEYRVDCSGSGHAQTRLEVPPKVVTPPRQGQRSDSTGTIRLFYDAILSYSSAELTLSLNTTSAEYRGIAVIITQGTSDHTSFLAYIRIVYAMFSVAAAYLWTQKASLSAFRDWAFEQKITFALLLVSIMSNNPLYLWHAYRPLRMWPIIDLVVTPLFHGCVYTVILVVFDLLLRKNLKSEVSLCRPELLLGIAVFVNEFSILAFQIFWPVWAPRPFKSRWEVFAEQSQIVINLAFVVWASARALTTIRSIDVTEKFHTYLYVIAASSVILQAFFVLVVAKLFGWFQKTATDFVSAFAVHNNFTLMMLYFHWPYEPVTDMRYEVSGARVARKSASAQPGPIVETLELEDE